MSLMASVKELGERAWTPFDMTDWKTNEDVSCCSFHSIIYTERAKERAKFAKH